MQLTPQDRVELLQAIRECAKADSDAQQRERKRGDDALTAQWKAEEKVRSLDAMCALLRREYDAMCASHERDASEPSVEGVKRASEWENKCGEARQERDEARRESEELKQRVDYSDKAICELEKTVGHLRDTLQTSMAGHNATLTKLDEALKRMDLVVTERNEAQSKVGVLEGIAAARDAELAQLHTPMHETSATAYWMRKYEEVSKLRVQLSMLNVCDAHILLAQLEKLQKDFGVT